MKHCWVVIPQCTGDLGESEIDADQVAVGPFSSEEAAQNFSREYCFNHTEIRPMLIPTQAIDYSDRTIFDKGLT